MGPTRRMTGGGGHTRRIAGGGGHTRRVTGNMGPTGRVTSGRGHIHRAAGRLLAERLVAPSGAGHDSAGFEDVGVPSAMGFVRNAHGSHHPDEAMDIDDFMLGAEVPRRSLAALAD